MINNQGPFIFLIFIFIYNIYVFMMKHLKLFINESEETIESLRDYIINSINRINNIEYLKKIKRKLKTTTSESFSSMKDTIINYFAEICGWKEGGFLSKTILQKINHYDCWDETYHLLLVNTLKHKDENNLNDDEYFTSNDLINGNNIYANIEKYYNNVIGTYDTDFQPFNEFKEFLIDIADFKKGDNSVSVGAYENLCRMFMNDLNPKNEKVKDKTNNNDKGKLGDINSTKYAFEFKVENGRIGGNKNETKPKSQSVINDTFISLISLIFNIENDSELNKNNYASGLRLNNIDTNNKEVKEFINKVISNPSNLGSAENIKYCVSNLLKFGVNIEIIEDIILKSFLSQQEITFSNDDITYIKDNYSIKDKNNNLLDSKQKGQRTEQYIVNIRYYWLLLNVYAYKSTEDFDYMVLFDSDINTGNYVCFDFTKTKDNMSIKKIDEILDNKVYNDKLPANTGGSNSQNALPSILLKKIREQ